MKKLTSLTIALIITLTMAACSSNTGTPNNSAVTPPPSSPTTSATPEAAAPQNTAPASGLLYTNLVDKDSQDEVKTILTNAGIKSEYVDEVFSWIDLYNAGLVDFELFKLAPGFTQIDENYVSYGTLDDYYEVSTQWRKVNKYEYTDVLCRSTAYALMRDYITVKNLVPKSEWHIIDDENDDSKSRLVTDWEGIQTNPYLKFSETEITQYFSLFNPVQLSEVSTEETVYAAIKNEWEARGVSFKAGAVSLISVWEKSADFSATIHVGVLAEYDGGLLLFEKTNPQYPYQATKFNGLDEVKEHMIRSITSYWGYESGAETLIVMQNDRLL